MITINLSQLLKDRDISQREFSRQTGIRQPTVSEMCLNRSKSLPVENLDTICNYLECSIEELITHTKEHSD